MESRNKFSFSALLHDLVMLAGTFSSAFFLVFLVFYMLAPQFIIDLQVLGTVSACLFILGTSSIVSMRLRQLIRMSIEVAGSIIFLIMLAYSYLIPDSSSAVQLKSLIRVLEIILNQGAIGLVLLLACVVIAIPVLIKVFEWALKGIIFLFKGLHIQNQYVKAGSVLVVLLIPLLLWWSAGQYMAVSDPAWLSYGASVLAPFLGFSLIYLHATLLYKNLVGATKELPS